MANLELVRELNETIGAIRALSEYLSDDNKLLVDNFGVPTIMRLQKNRILNQLKSAEIVMDKAVCHLSGYPWIQKQ